MAINGWVILDKPSGITSAHAVAKVKRLLSSPGADKIKIGHAGTLDPLASGVLPLALGEATKTVAYLMDAAKSYGFTVRWGEARDTDDSEGAVVATSDRRPTREEIEAVLPRFIGEISQMPPDYSAIKVDGKRAYDVARGGEAPMLAARKVRVDGLVVAPSPCRGEGRGGGKSVGSEFATSPLLTSPLQGEGLTETSLICHCGKGTYIRSLSRDMGRQLGCFGHVTRLRRLRVGRFDEACAISLEKLEIMVHKGDLGFLQPVASALDDILAVNVTVDEATRLQRGQHVIFHQTVETSIVRAQCDGKLIAMCEVIEGGLKPLRVFNL